MDDGTLLNFALVLLFVLIGGVFAGTEMAMVSLREGQIRKIEEAGGQGRKTAGLVRDPNLFLAAVQVGVTAAGFLSSAYGASTIAPDIAPVLEGWGLPGDAASTVAFIGTTLLIVYLSLVLGELVPKRLAMQRPVAFTRLLAPPLNVLAQFMRPAIWLLSVSTNGVVRLLGGDPHATTDRVSADEVRALIVSHPDIREDSKSILSDVFRAGDRRLVEVMRPRPDVDFLAGGLTVAEAHRLSLDLPHSRFPVTGESFDDVLGFVHIRDLMTRTSRPGPTGADDLRLADIVRPILALPATNHVLDALSTMRRRNDQIALVVDEYGGTDGIVTLEDLLEEVVGEIYDEYDEGAEPEDSALHRGAGVEIDGGLILDELREMTGVDLPEGPYETVGGFIVNRLGRIARTGDRVDGPGWRLEVLTVDARRIARVRVTEHPS